MKLVMVDSDRREVYGPVRVPAKGLQRRMRRLLRSTIHQPWRAGSTTDNSVRALKRDGTVKFAIWV
jgi:hypothetical protein